MPPCCPGSALSQVVSWQSRATPEEAWKFGIRLHCLHRDKVRPLCAVQGISLRLYAARFLHSVGACGEDARVAIAGSEGLAKECYICVGALFPSNCGEISWTASWLGYRLEGQAGANVRFFAF